MSQLHLGPSRYLEGLPQPGRTLVMGVVNTTPDSFSDGGQYVEPEAAVAHGLELVANGADLIDVGGESTRPGAERPSLEAELSRVIPVIESLAGHGVLVSIDTMRASVAEAAVQAGAVLVNDVSGGLADEAMLPTIARLGVPCVLMHWRSHSAQMQQHTNYDDVVEEVYAALQGRLRAAAQAGITAGVAVDPGIGFSKTAEQNWALLAGLERFGDLGHPVLVATSRKRFLGTLLGDREPAGRDDATTATTVLAAARGAWCVRVHRARAAADAVQVAHRWAEAEAVRNQ